ncbi:MAG TPA: hypothetical protein VF603_02665 [Allosphingosinicella sp.]|jgi:hypothetical protein
MKKLVQAGMICAAVTTVTGTAQAQRRGAATSAYTALDLKRCTVLSSNPDEGAGTDWRCPGYRGIPLLVAEDDLRFDINAGVDTADFETASRFNSPGPRVEWRLRGGQPFAIIYRLVLSWNDLPKRTILGVETIGRRGRPGCLVAWVAASAPNANAVARQQADQRAASFRCGRDRPARIGDLENLLPVAD